MSDYWVNAYSVHGKFYLSDVRWFTRDEAAKAVAPEWKVLYRIHVIPRQGHYIGLDR